MVMISDYGASADDQELTLSLSLSCFYFDDFLIFLDDLQFIS